MSSTDVPDAFREVTELWTPALLRYLQRFAGDPATAEDLLQETLLRTARASHAYAGRASVKTWAFSIAARVAADYLRDPERRAHIVEIGEAREPENPDAPADEHLIVGEMNTCIREVLDSLPEDYRSALVLHEFEEMTAAEVAAVLECSLATAKIRIHRGRVRLREALRQDCRFYRDRHNSLRCDRRQ